MIKVYGIPTCDTVRKARKFFKENNIEIEFINFKKTSVGTDKVEAWLEHIELDKLFNNRGKTYRDLKLKDLNLDDTGRKKWLVENNMLFKRPIVEFNNEALVGFDEEKYKEIFSKENI